MFATKTPPSSFGQAASNKSRGAVVVSGGKAAAAAAASSADTATVGGMAIKKNETFVRRQSTEQAKRPSAQSSTPVRPEPVKLQQENFQAAAETAPRKVIMAAFHSI